MKLQRPYLLSPWRTDHARLLHSLSLFVYSVYRGQPQGPSLLHTGEQVIKLLSGPAAPSSTQRQKLAPSMLGEMASVITTSCIEGWLPVLCETSPSLSIEHRQKAEERVFPGL